VINVDELTTIPKSMLDRYVTTLSQQKMGEVNRAIRFALALG
jgi:mRNA-degrading endonuclease toxin of MazEF toxin-antitoxin module